MNEQEFRQFLREQAFAAGGQKALADRLAMSENYLSTIMTGKRRMGKSILQRLGIERVCVYRKTA